MYKGTEWADDVYDPVTGELILEGTPVDAARLNQMEKGIADAHRLAESGTVSMTSAGEYPFPGTSVTIQLAKERPKLDYQVEWELVDSNGPVSEVVISKRYSDRFDAYYVGSATTATLRYFVTGGF